MKKWLHETTDWPKFVWDDDKLKDELIKFRHRQGRLLGRMEKLGFNLELEAALNKDAQRWETQGSEANLEQEAALSTLTVGTIASSAIEGEHLKLEEVRSSFARRLNIKHSAPAPTNRHVEGIVQMMLDATQNYAKPLTQKRLFGWHTALFPTAHNGKHPITVGAWRDGPIQVSSGYMGREKVHFEAPDAKQVAAEMKTFLNWFNQTPKCDPVLKAGIAHLWFVTIHPFDDGNGRITRAISELALARADGTAKRFYSHSVQILAEHKAYYRHLETQQRGTLDISGWLDWYLRSLTRALTNAQQMLSNILFKAQLWQCINQQQPVNKRQHLILRRMINTEFKGYMNNAKYAKIAKCSDSSALRDILNLKARGIFIQNAGGGRSTSYRLTATLKTIVVIAD